MRNSLLRRTAAQLVGPIAQLGRLVLLRMGMIVSPRTIVEGIELVALADVGREIELQTVRQIAAALRLIKSTDPVRWSRVRRDLKRILVTEVGGPLYVHPVRAALLRAGYVHSASVAYLALTLVHEATHARLWSRGIRYAAADRERIERICVRAEVAFAERQEQHAQLVQSARAKLSERWWEKDSGSCIGEAPLTPDRERT